MWEPKNDANLIKAVNKFLEKNGWVLPDYAVFEPIIDGVDIYIGNDLILMVGLPPVSNYSITKTEFAEKHLKVNDLAAV